MPYNKESKRIAKEYMREVRAKTVCKNCGKQPVDFHRYEHEADSNLRVSALTARGHPIKRIQEEIDLCEALCRTCHMTEDNRLKELRKNCPNQKGTIFVQPKPCDKCGKLSKPIWKNKCRSCYDFERRHPDKTM